MANISEEPALETILGNVQNCAVDALKMLSLDGQMPEPQVAVRALNEYIRSWQKGQQPQAAEFEDVRLCMAALWGELLRHSFGWQWAWVTFHDHGDSRALGMFSLDRSLAIYPFEFLLGCMQDAGVPVTIELAYNMLQAGSIPALPAYGYENVMAGVTHVVPPD